MQNNDDLLWVSKYRPKMVNDCILPNRIKKPFLEFVKQKSMPNLLLSGSAGTGKTSISKALCNDMGYEHYLINASRERNIDMVRDTIHQISSTISIDGKPKAIILDEADYLNPIAQGALRGAIEEFSHVRFILTCNYKNRLIEPLHSRTSVIEFNILSSEKEDMLIKFLLRILQILKIENIKFDKKSVATIVKKLYPDFRKTLNSLQRYSAGGVIDSGIVSHIEGSNIEELLKFIKDKDLGACRQWVSNNADVDVGTLFTDMYNKFYNEIHPDHILNMIQLIADYQYKSNFAASQEINTMALIASIMGTLKFKK